MNFLENHARKNLFSECREVSFCLSTNSQLATYQFDSSVFPLTQQENNTSLTCTQRTTYCTKSANWPTLPSINSWPNSEYGTTNSDEFPNPKNSNYSLHRYWFSNFFRTNGNQESKKALFTNAKLHSRVSRTNDQNKNSYCVRLHADFTSAVDAERQVVVVARSAEVGY